MQAPESQPKQSSKHAFVQEEKKTKQNSSPSSKTKSAPFYPPGKMHYPSDVLRGQFSRAECLSQLEQELTTVWPSAFLQV